MYPIPIGIDGIDPVHQTEQFHVTEHRSEGVPNPDAHFRRIIQHGLRKLEIVASEQPINREGCLIVLLVTTPRQFRR